MANDSRPSTEYRVARIASAILLIALVVLLGVLDAVRTDFEVNPLVLIALLATAGGMLGVDIRIPGSKRE